MARVKLIAKCLLEKADGRARATFQKNASRTPVDKFGAGFDVVSPDTTCGSLNVSAIDLPFRLAMCSKTLMASSSRPCTTRILHIKNKESADEHQERQKCLDSDKLSRSQTHLVRLEYVPNAGCFGVHDDKSRRLLMLTITHTINRQCVNTNTNVE